VLQLWTILLLVRHQQQLSKVVSQPVQEHRQVPTRSIQVTVFMQLYQGHYPYHFAIINGDGGCDGIIRSVTGFAERPPMVDPPFTIDFATSAMR
jgi:hypothetical protein